MRDWGDWFHIFFPQILLSSLVDHIWRADSYQGRWPGTRENVSSLVVWAVATHLPRSRFSTDRQTEKCLGGCVTEKRPKVNAPAIHQNFWKTSNTIFTQSFYFSISATADQENNWWGLIASWQLLKRPIYGGEKPSFLTTSVGAELHWSAHGSSTKSIECVQLKHQIQISHVSHSQEKLRVSGRERCANTFFQCSKTGAVVQAQRRCRRSTDGGSVVLLGKVWESIEVQENLASWREK